MPCVCSGQVHRLGKGNNVFSVGGGIEVTQKGKGSRTDSRLTIFEDVFPLLGLSLAEAEAALVDPGVDVDLVPGVCSLAVLLRRDCHRCATLQHIKKFSVSEIMITSGKQSTTCPRPVVCL